jgi:hypothetical protein
MQFARRLCRAPDSQSRSRCLTGQWRSKNAVAAVHPRASEMIPVLRQVSSNGIIADRLCLPANRRFKLVESGK